MFIYKNQNQKDIKEFFEIQKALALNARWILNIIEELMHSFLYIFLTIVHIIALCYLLNILFDFQYNMNVTQDFSQILQDVNQISLRCYSGDQHSTYWTKQTFTKSGLLLLKYILGTPLKLKFA